MRTQLIRRQFRRRLRKGQQQVGDLGSITEQGLEEHIFRRFDNLLAVRRFAVGWVGLLVLVIGMLVTQNILLSGYYQAVRAVPGGIYNEGVLGNYTNANPIFATSDADSTVSHLIFASLFTYDNQGHLIGDLAKSYKPDEHGLTYTVQLKPNLRWQDGRPLTSADVLFTYQTIQNPDTQSPLESSWQGIKVSAPNKQTVVFRLPDPLASFPYSLTNGIVPQHILDGVPAADLRSSDFNTIHPIGAGPFAIKAVQATGGDPETAQQQIALLPFANYQAGRPKLEEFVVHAYASQDQLISDFKTRQLTAAEGLKAVPKGLDAGGVQAHNLLLRAQTMVFFKTTSGVLADQAVRQALVQGANVPAIISKLGYSTRQVREPFLTGQLGYDPSLAQADFDRTKAAATLDAAGWKIGKNNFRYKDGKPLTFTLTAADTPEYRMVAGMLIGQWHQLGVTVRPQLQASADFETSLAYHSYDAVLYGITIGADPDVFVYWDSSQADIRSANRLNLSEYKNATADTALEAGRTRLDPTLRTVKYRPFLQAWQKDAPALGLYQPRLLYLTNGSVYGLQDGTLNTATDRFADVQNWEIRQAKVTN